MEAEYEKLAQELLKRMDEDISFRESLEEEDLEESAYRAKIERFTNKNAEWLHRQIMNIGEWPSADIVGDDASDAAWYLAQNSFGHPAFMRFALQMMEQALEFDKLPYWQFAYLYDAICYFSNKPQRYGTQWDFDADGNMSPFMLEDAAAVDDWRKLAGLNSLEQRKREIYLEMIDSGMEAPKNPKKRLDDLHKWRKETGWLS